jgi:lipopolysaccharide export LptBFGC system permease protein LptF
LFKNYIKAKKGKELIEIIVMFPIVLFLIMFSLVQILSMTFSSQVQQTSNAYSRELITDRTLYDAVVSLGDYIKEQEKNDSSFNTTVLRITIIDKNTGKKYNMTFSDDETEGTYFTKVCHDGVFNIEVSDTLKNNYMSASKYWIRGNYIEIEVMKPIAKIINSISKISIYNAQTKQRDTLDYGTTGYVKAITKNIIIG